MTEGFDWALASQPAGEEPQGEDLVRRFLIERESPIGYPRRVLPGRRGSQGHHQVPPNVARSAREK